MVGPASQLPVEVKQAWRKPTSSPPRCPIAGIRRWCSSRRRPEDRPIDWPATPPPRSRGDARHRPPSASSSSPRQWPRDLRAVCRPGFDRGPRAHLPRQLQPTVAIRECRRLRFLTATRGGPGRTPPWLRNPGRHGCRPAHEPVSAWIRGSDGTDRLPHRRAELTENALIFSARRRRSCRVGKPHSIER